MIKEQCAGSLEQAVVAAETLRLMTESAAVAAAPWIGSGDKIAADRAAVNAMHVVLSTGRIACEVAIGEGVKDGAPILEHGRRYGPPLEEPLSLAVDPIEGTTFVASGRPGGMAVAAFAESGAFPKWIGVPYMRKLVVGPEAAYLFDSGDAHIDDDPARNIRRVAEALDKPLAELHIAVLDRERNSRIIHAAHSLGAKLLLLEGGDVQPAMRACLHSGVDMLYGSGGSPEGVLTAAFAAATGGNMQVAWDPQNDMQRSIAGNLNLLHRTFSLGELTGNGAVHFAATGITDSELLRGCTNAAGVWQPGTSLVVSRLGTVGQEANRLNMR